MSTIRPLLCAVVYAAGADGPSALMSNGVPYLLREFRATRRGISTAAYDKATTDGKPMEIVPLAGPAKHQHELPLDRWITDLPE